MSINMGDGESTACVAEMGGKAVMMSMLGQCTFVGSLPMVKVMSDFGRQEHGAAIDPAMTTINDFMCLTWWSWVMVTAEDQRHDNVVPLCRWTKVGNLPTNAFDIRKKIFCRGYSVDESFCIVCCMSGLVGIAYYCLC